MDGYNPGLLHVGHDTRASVKTQSEASLGKTYLQVLGRHSKDPGEHDDFRGQFSAIQGTIELGQGFLSISLPDSQEKWKRPFYHEVKATEPVHYLHKVQNGHHEADKGGHSSRTISSLTQHLVSILPHSNCKETSLLLLLQVERQSLPVQDLALQSIHCPQDLHEGHKAYSSLMSKDGYKNISIPQ